jgi:hypothetical protein
VPESPADDLLLYVNHLHATEKRERNTDIKALSLKTLSTGNFVAVQTSSLKAKIKSFKFEQKGSFFERLKYKTSKLNPPARSPASLHVNQGNQCVH